MNPVNSFESQRTMVARKRLLQMHFESGVGHIGGNLSCLDILLALYHDAYASRKLPEYMHHRLLCCNRCVAIDVMRSMPARCQTLQNWNPLTKLQRMIVSERRQRLLADAGLRSVFVTPLYNRYPISYWIRLFPFPSAVKSALLWSLRTSGTGGIPLTLPAGNLLAYGFR